MLVPIRDEVRESGHTKMTKKKGTKKKMFYWIPIHQQVFNKIKQLMTHNIIMAYTNFELPFDMYTNESDYQLNTVMDQNNRLIAFISRKSHSAQRQCNKLIRIVEILREFKGILLGQKIEVCTDQKNLVQDALDLNSKWVIIWRLLLEESQPEIVHITGIANTLAIATNMELACHVSKDILKSLDENDYINGKHVPLSGVLSQLFQDNIDMGTSSGECLANISEAEKDIDFLQLLK